MFSAVSLWNRFPEQFNFLIDYRVFYYIIFHYFFLRAMCRLSGDFKCYEQEVILKSI